jgi:AcrR family transcriptional regulator
MTRETEDLRKDAILKAVLDIAARDGFDAVTIRKVAAAAGVSHSLVRYHYENKERLIVEAWWALHQWESRRRDETVGRVSGLDRVVEGFRLAFEEETDLPDSLRLDFWAKTARTASLLRLFTEGRDSMTERHIAGLEASAREGKIAPEWARDLGLLEDFIQAVTFGIHAWASLQLDKPMAAARAMKLVRLTEAMLSQRQSPP